MHKIPPQKKNKTFWLPFERNFSNFHLTKKLNGVNDNLLLLGFLKFIKIATMLLFYVAWTTTDDDGDANNDVTPQTKHQLSIFYALNACQFFKKIHNLTPFQCSQQAHNFIINEIKVATYTFTDPNVVTLYIFGFSSILFWCYCCCFCCSLFVTFVHCGLNTFLEVFLLIVGVYCVLYKFLSLVVLFRASYLVLLQSSCKICCNFFLL